MAGPILLLLNRGRIPHHILTLHTQVELYTFALPLALSVSVLFTLTRKLSLTHSPSTSPSPPLVIWHSCHTLELTRLLTLWLALTCTLKLKHRACRQSFHPYCHAWCAAMSRALPSGSAFQFALQPGPTPSCGQTRRRRVGRARSLAPRQARAKRVTYCPSWRCAQSSGWWRRTMSTTR